MPFEALFSLVGLLSMSGWIALLLSPWIPVWSDRIAGVLVPVLLACVYMAVSVLTPPAEGGFATFSDVRTLFTYDGAVLAGWLHFLAFDLVVGAWACRKGREDGMPFWMVLPCLPLIFMLGPVGFFLFCGLRAAHRWRAGRSRTERLHSETYLSNDKPIHLRESLNDGEQINSSTLRRVSSSPSAPFIWIIT